MDVDKDKIFRGYLPPISIENEVAAWKHIKKVSIESLKEYKTTIKQDKKRLKKHKKEEEILEDNELNCIKYSLIEKKPLQFLIDTADKIEEIVGMKRKQAKKEVKSWDDTNKLKVYFKKTIIKLMK